MNVFTFCGNLGNDCRTNTVGGTFVANFSVAVTSGFGDKKETHWIDCAHWGKGAEAVSQYLKKGQKVVVSGEAGMKPAGDKYPAAISCRVNQLTLAGGKTETGSAPTPKPSAAENLPASTFDDGDCPF